MKNAKYNVLEYNYFFGELLPCMGSENSDANTSFYDLLQKIYGEKEHPQ